MQAHVVARRIAGFAHEVDLGDGFEMVVDEPAEGGGTETGPGPGQLLATSLAGCTAITIELYAKRKGWELDGLAVSVDMTSTDVVPDRFEVEVALPDGLDDEQRQRLMVIAAKCPVHKALEQGAEITVVERTSA